MCHVGVGVYLGLRREGMWMTPLGYLGEKGTGCHGARWLFVWFAILYRMLQHSFHRCVCVCVCAFSLALLNLGIE